MICLSHSQCQQTCNQKLYPNSFTLQSRLLQRESTIRQRSNQRTKHYHIRAKEDDLIFSVLQKNPIVQEEDLTCSSQKKFSEISGRFHQGQDTCMPRLSRDLLLQIRSSPISPEAVSLVMSTLLQQGLVKHWASFSVGSSDSRMFHL